MCGIVGYIGEKNSVPILVEGLKRLEYRGYDSSGISLISGDDDIVTYKKTGKIAAMESTLPRGLESITGIGHTRWATHGEITDSNSHPHFSENKTVAIVHNGIIENYKKIKDNLSAKGYTFHSQTDSEVIAYLIEDNIKLGFERAFYKTLSYLRGTFGIAAICKNEPDKILVARKGSPLVVGIGNNEMFIASDVHAFLGYTKQVVYLEDNEIAIVEKNNLVTKNFKLADISKDISTIDWEPDSIDMNGFPHYMLKEIYEQPESIKRAYAGRFIEDIGTTKLGGLNLTPQELSTINRVRIIGCGTSYHAGLVAECIIEDLARINTDVEIASELRYKNPIIDRQTLFFAVSQSGETLDTLLAMREIQRKGSKVLGICNVVGSTIPRESNGGTYVHSGPEIAVASTKAFTSQLTAFYLFAVLLGRMRDVNERAGKKMINDLKRIPGKIETILEKTAQIEQVAKEFAKLNNFIFLGKGISYPVALEGALKLKEVSYLYSEGVPAGEIKHGPIALIDKNTPVVFIIPQDDVYEKTISSMEEIKTRGGIVLAICYEGDEKVKALADYSIEIPKTNSLLSPLLTIVPLQLFAYFIARELGRDIDKPRNLAKSVTVE